MLFPSVVFAIFLCFCLFGGYEGVYPLIVCSVVPERFYRESTPLSFPSAFIGNPLVELFPPVIFGFTFCVFSLYLFWFFCFSGDYKGALPLRKVLSSSGSLLYFSVFKFLSFSFAFRGIIKGSPLYCSVIRGFTPSLFFLILRRKHAGVYFPSVIIKIFSYLSCF